MASKFGSWWQKIKQHRVAIGVVGIVLVVVIALIIVGYWFDWTGFNGYNKVTIAHTISGTNAGTVTRTEEYQPGKALWDWLGLLATLAIPIVVGFGVAWFTAQQGKVSDRENTDNQREAALQAYIDKTSELLLKEQLGELEPEYKEVRKIARVRTLTTLRRLDSDRKGILLQFLYDTGLIKGTENNMDKPIVDLQPTLDWINLRTNVTRVADLSGANLRGADLHGAILRGTNLRRANLREANLELANLSESDLREANLQKAHLLSAILTQAKLRGADLRGADLRGADLSGGGTHLIGADLNGADLRGADLRGANLQNTDLSGADLSGAINTTSEQLEKAESLKGTIMPDGRTHP